METARFDELGHGRHDPLGAEIEEKGIGDAVEADHAHPAVLFLFEYSHDRPFIIATERTNSKRTNSKPPDSPVNISLSKPP
jgi:hypothetical protein